MKDVRFVTTNMSGLINPTGWCTGMYQIIDGLTSLVVVHVYVYNVRKSCIVLCSLLLCKFNPGGQKAYDMSHVEIETTSGLVMHRRRKEALFGGGGGQSINIARAKRVRNF